MTTKKIVVFLQNAWSISEDYVKHGWPRPSWLAALHRSRSGQRLRVLAEAAPGVDFWYDNATSKVGGHPNSVLPPDPAHIREVLDEVGPCCVVACGVHAARSLSSLNMRRLLPLLIVPHPAHRFLTDALYRRAGAILLAGFTGSVRLSQKKGSVLEEALNDLD